MATAMTNPLTVARGAARIFGATARALALDVAAGIGAATSLLGDRSAPASLPVHVLILADENGTPLCRPEDLRASLDRADRVFRAGAGIRVRVAGIDTVAEPAPGHALDLRSNRRLLIDDMAGHTAFFRERLPIRSPLSTTGDPITVVVVRSITGRTTGCSLGMSADWVVCRASLFDHANPRTYDETVLAHELGHALNLPHLSDAGNLMNPTSSPPDRIRGTALRSWQAALMHANRHTVPSV